MSAAFIALVNEHDELLCLHHTYGGGGWGIPGGYVDKDETAFEAATREFSEETGNTYPINHINSIVEIFPDQKSTTFVSRVKKNVVTIRKSTSREIDDMKWMTKKELDTVKLRPIFASYYELIFLVE